MDIYQLLARVDHTQLSQNAAWGEIKLCCDEGIEYKTASVCIPPSFVERAACYVMGRVRICTVIGFPNGYSTPAVKSYEIRDAIGNGADEIDMVINIGDLKSRRYDMVERELREAREACCGKTLKVIIEACLLTEEEKIRMCGLVTEAGADYIKTSTGFSSGGAAREDVLLFKRHIGDGVKIKAAGGIRTLQQAEEFISLGCSRIGSSRLVSAARALKEETG